MDDKYTITIYPYQLNGKKTTSKGTTYFEIIGQDKKKYRLYDEGLYNRFEVNKSYDVSVSKYSDSFTNDKGKKVDYTLYTIHNIESLPPSPSDSKYKSIDDAIGKWDSVQGNSTELPTPPVQEEPQEPNWDEINFGKTRTQIVNGVLSNMGLVEPDDDMEDLIRQWTNIAFYGKREK